MAMLQKFTVALVSRPVMQKKFPDKTKHFPGLSRTTVILKYFQGLAFATSKFKDFQGFSRTRGYPALPKQSVL